MSSTNLLKVKARLKRQGMKAIPDHLAQKIAGLSEKIGLTKAISTSMKSVKRCTAIYNEACSVCKNKIIRNPDLSEDEYCPGCRHLVKKHLGDMAE